MNSRDSKQVVGMTEDIMSSVAEMSKLLSYAHESDLVEMTEKIYWILDDIRAIARRGI